jgi:hypothetical protein
MKKIFLIPVAGLVLFFSCKEQKPGGADTNHAGKKGYFPVVDFIKGQIHDVDSLPLALLQIVIANNRKDSSYIKQNEFHELAQNFILPEAEPGNFEKKFKENLFLDQTTRSATFNYTAEDSATRVKRIDVLATPDELLSKVMSVFIQENYTRNDTTIVRKLLWETNKEFEIILIVQPPNQPRTMTQTIVIWDEHG